MKMIKFIMPIMAVLVLIACGGDSDTEATAEIPGHLLVGEIENADGKEAVLIAFEGEKEKIIDTVKIENGRFEIQTETKELRQYVLLIGSEEMPIILLLDENSKDVNIKGSLPGIGENYTITGSDESQYVKDYLLFLKPFFETESGIYAELNALPPNDTTNIKSLMGELDSISLIQRDFALTHINSHEGSPASWLMLRELFPASGLLNFDTTDLAYFRQVSAELAAKYPYSEYPDLINRDVASVTAQIAQMNNPEVAVAPGTAPFEYAPEITLMDVNGNEASLSSLRGQVVLIDFWASWCKPCRMENPNVVRLYDQYKDKGFTVFSVSLDTDKAKWEEAIAVDNLSWPNHVSDLQGWTSPAATSYGVNAIPATFLIDETGKVIGTNLRGEALEQKLQEVLG